MDGCWFAAAVHQLLTTTYPRFSCTFVVFAVDTTVLTLLQIPSTGESSCSIWRLPWIRDASFSNTPKWQILGLPHHIPIDLHQILSRVFYPQILHQLHHLTHISAGPGRTGRPLLRARIPSRANPRCWGKPLPVSCWASMMCAMASAPYRPWLMEMDPNTTGWWFAENQL